jgi:hypothetical protein
LKTLQLRRRFFPDTPRFRELCAPIYKFRTLTLKSPVPHDGSIESVTQWKEQLSEKYDRLRRVSTASQLMNWKHICVRNCHGETA